MVFSIHFVIKKSSCFFDRVIKVVIQSNSPLILYGKLVCTIQTNNVNTQVIYAPYTEKMKKKKENIKVPRLVDRFFCSILLTPTKLVHIQLLPEKCTNFNFLNLVCFKVL